MFAGTEGTGCLCSGQMSFEASVCRQTVIPNKEVGKQCLLKSSVYCFSSSDRSEVENSLKILAPAEQTKGSVAFDFVHC